MLSFSRVSSSIGLGLGSLAVACVLAGCAMPKMKSPHTWMWNDSRIQHLVTENAAHSGWTGLVSHAEDGRYRVESIPMWRSRDLRTMRVVTFTYERQKADTGTVFARVVDSRGKALEPVVSQVTSGGNPGLGEELLTGQPKETVVEGMRVVSRMTRGEEGKTVYLFEKWSTAGNDTFLTHTRDK